MHAGKLLYLFNCTGHVQNAKHTYACKQVCNITMNLLLMVK